MDYKKKITNSGIAFRIKSISKQIFSQWLENAKDVYGLSPELFNKIKDDEVENTFLAHLERAIEALVENKSDKKKSIRGWSFGYLCGHLQGSIEVEWVNKYIIEPSQEYEDLMKIKAIIEYLNFDDTSLDKIFSIYQYLITQRIQPTGSIEVTSSNVISIFKHKSLNQVKENEFKENINDILSKELELKFMKLINKKNDICCPDISKYLDIQDIKNIAGEKQFA